MTQRNDTKTFEPFSEIDGGAVITVSRGVYRQNKLMRRAGHIYAKHGGGAVKLYPNGGTSSQSVVWSQIEPGPAADFTADALGVAWFSLEAAE